MKLKTLFISLLLPLAGLSGLFAQDEKPVNIGGQIFFNFGYEYKNPDQANNGKERTAAFSADRVRINVSKEFDSVWSVLVSAEGNSGTASKTYASDTTPKYVSDATFYVRNAIFNAKFGSDDLKVSLGAGVFTNPLIAAWDTQRQDRWLSKDNYDNASALNLKNQDYSVVYGAQLKLDILKIVSVTAAIANGGNQSSYLETTTASGKAIIGIVTVNPLDGFFINIWGSDFLQQVADPVSATGEQKQFNYGAGAGVNLSGVRAGVNIGILSYKTKDTAGVENGKIEGLLVDTYLNANLKDITGVPVLAILRYGYGKTKDSYVANGGANGVTSEISFGIGYQFNNKAQLALFYQHYLYPKDYDAAGATTAAAKKFDNGAKQTLYGKAELKF